MKNNDSDNYNNDNNANLNAKCEANGIKNTIKQKQLGLMIRTAQLKNC
jgi:hypothetical protein